MAGASRALLRWRPLAQVLGQEGLQFAQHLDAGRRIRQPMIVAAQFHEAHVLAGGLQAREHAPGLIDRHHRIVGAMDEQDWNAHAVGKIGRRNRADMFAIFLPIAD